MEGEAPVSEHVSDALESLRVCITVQGKPALVDEVNLCTECGSPAITTPLSTAIVETLNLPTFHPFALNWRNLIRNHFWTQTCS